MRGPCHPASRVASVLAALTALTALQHTSSAPAVLLAAAFEGERPRDDRSITNCNALRKHLGPGVEKAAAKAKKLSKPEESLPPTLELTVRYLLAKVAAAPTPMPMPAPALTPQRVRVDDDELARTSGPGSTSRSRPTRMPDSSSFTAAAVPATAAAHAFATSPPPRTIIRPLSPFSSAAATRPTTLHRPEPPALDVDDGFVETEFQRPLSRVNLSNGSGGGGGGGGVEMDVEDFDDDVEEHFAQRDTAHRSSSAVSATPSRAPPTAPMRGAGAGHFVGSVRLSTSDAASLKELLFAKQGGRQPASWVQGLLSCQPRPYTRNSTPWTLNLRPQISLAKPLNP